MTQDERRAPVRPADVAFFVFFGLIFAASIAAVVVGFGSYLASISSDLHETFHVRALGTGQIARAYQRMADAAHVMPSVAVVWLAFAFSFLNLTLAAFLVWLRPRDRTARLLAVGMVGTAAIFNLPAQSTLEILPFTTFESTIHTSVHILTPLAYTFALLLFPDGRLVPRWRVPAQIALYAPVVAASVVLALTVEGGARPGVLLLFFGLVAPVAGVAAQGYRFRTTNDPAEHRQARLLFWALAPAIGVGAWFVLTQGFGTIDPGLAGRHLPEQPVEVFRVFLPVFLLVPLALFAGILRYRLWDIDRVINRTMVYGLVTGILLGAYSVIVVLLQGLLRPFTAGSDIAVAASTLAVAAAFLPVRRRIQTFVDRRFYRHRYDTQRTIESFTVRLRDQVDIQALASELRAAVSQTMQPETVSLLLRGEDGSLRWQWTYRGASRPVTVPERRGGSQAPRMSMEPADPLFAFFQQAPEAVDVGRLRLDSPAMEAMKGDGVKLAVPLVSQGELIGVLCLGPRLSEQEYSPEDRRLLGNLATHAAPALRVAQLVQEHEDDILHRERYEQELRIAHLIQQNFLPTHAPELEGWALAGFYRSAREVGGDFYDFIELPEGRLGIVIGDVTDKGVPAALMMASTRSVLRSVALRIDNPGGVLEEANDLLCPDMPPKMFVTCLYAVLEVATGRLVYANAGHNVPYRQGEDCLCEELKARGMPLGLLPGSPYEEREVVVQPGDTVLFTSDGIVEAHNPGGEMFGCPRLVELVGAHNTDDDLRQVVMDALEAFTGTGWEQEDDITMVTLQRADTGNLHQTLRVSSSPGNERQAIRQVTETIAPLGLEPDRLEKVKTAVAEATMNAIEHGNKSNPDLDVTIDVKASDSALRIRVTDLGGGVEIPDETSPDIDAKLRGEQSPRGWGLFLMKSMVDEVNVTTDDIHHTVELVVRLEP